MTNLPTGSETHELGASLPLSRREYALMIARLEPEDPGRHLRALYPELEFLFDRLEAQEEERTETVTISDYTAMEERAQDAEWKLSCILDTINETWDSHTSAADKLETIYTIAEET